jgi:hypothetical protein
MSSEAPKQEEIPERPKGDAPEGEKGPSKKELKKMAKEKEKVPDQQLALEKGDHALTECNEYRPRKLRSV